MEKTSNRMEESLIFTESFERKLRGKATEQPVLKEACINLKRLNAEDVFNIKKSLKEGSKLKKSFGIGKRKKTS